MRIAMILSSLANQAPNKIAKEIVDFVKDKVDYIHIYYFDDIVELEFNVLTVKINFFDKIDFNKYDIIHTHMLRPDAYIFFQKRKIHKAIFINTIHNFIFSNLRSQYNLFIALIFAPVWLTFLLRQHYLVTLTSHMKQYYSRVIKHKRIQVIHNGVSPVLESINNSDRLVIRSFKGESLLIGTAARLISSKGIDVLIKGISLEKNSNYKLLIIGDGKEKVSLMNYAQKLGVSQRCLFLGYREQAYNYFPYFDIFAMASKSEGFGLTLIEAASLKCPCLCSDLPTFKELFSEEEVCFFKLDDFDSFTRALEILRKNLSTYSFNIFNIYLRKYSSEIMGSNYYSFYQKLLSSRD